MVLNKQPACELTHGFAGDPKSWTALEYLSPCVFICLTLCDLPPLEGGQRCQSESLYCGKLPQGLGMKVLIWSGAWKSGTSDNIFQAVAVTLSLCGPEGFLGIYD